jgi:hypothetical protein
MKKFTSIAIAFLLALSVVPAMAADQAGSDREPVTFQALDKAPLAFQAFSKLPAMEREAITPLTDTELAAIEGSRVDVCVVCLNLAVITQTNVNTGNATGVGVGGFFGNGTGVGIIDQSNSAKVDQSIN